ncbi:LytS/YhcK type 5TM receptor domain-containing protein [Alkalicoccus daliensis]|uniref:histidine kinase n=1 Tax=Alkalicoccus daliensis TaxID=745820 RepID=A0A1H0FZD0_9BACI|nr:LytS/YhcK type 5TM receptor domain-containing protein [Alkalicoccus daliensis]SDN99849.1 two-component system, LytT family, sensor histidine kinase LytS [Alkalicoccus daliensis]
MELFVIMLERLGIIVMVAFLMTRIPFVRRLIDNHDVTFFQRLSAALLFGFFGIIGTYTGVIVSTGETTYIRWVSALGEEEAIANARVIGVVVAGLLGGWKVGLGAGVIAGGHRLLLGGFTGVACGISTILAGLMAGLLQRYAKKGGQLSLPITFAVGALSETMQMGLILVAARPYEQAWTLVELIGLPMIFANGLGAAVFILIIRNVLKEEEKMAAVQSGRALNIADRTLTYMRQGLSVKSAERTCEILLQEVSAAAVSMTNRDTILSYQGVGADLYKEGGPIRTEVTKQVLATGNTFIGDAASFSADEQLPSDIKAAMIVPLKQNEQIVGTLKFYFRAEKEITSLERTLITGTTKILSNQLELAQVAELEKLARETEIKALQAQVSPHFLFNTMNIIVSMIRTDPERARKLLLSLSSFFRQNLAGTTKAKATIAEEVKQIRAYLDIQSARFDGAMEVVWDLDEAAMQYELPTMTLQPLVENAVKHGRKPGEEPLVIQIRIQMKHAVPVLSITDNGQGISRARLAALTKAPVSSEEGTGIGVYNVHRRLVEMMSSAAGLKISSAAGKGTSIEFALDVQEKEEAG